MTTRRHFNQLLGPGLSAAQARPDPSESRRPLKVVCVGAHPDDPESGCGGTLARYAELVHRVSILYLTRGERGIPGKSNQEAAAIRSAEAGAAAKILGAKPVFGDQINGAIELTESRVESFVKLVSAEEPDVVFTHWPIDSHLDHQVASILAFRAHVAGRGRFRLYYFEVNSGSQTQGFHPTDYVDITSTREKKKAALFAHRSQNGEEIYRKHHEVMENYRGREAGVASAEAFVQLAREGRASKLPGL